MSSAAVIISASRINVCFSIQLIDLVGITAGDSGVCFAIISVVSSALFTWKIDHKNVNTTLVRILVFQCCYIVIWEAMGAVGLRGEMNRNTRKRTFCHVRPTKTQISLRFRAV